MSWRRFSALLRGLGPQSASVARAQTRRLHERSGDRVVAIETPEAATNAMRALFGPPPDGRGKPA